MKNNAKKGTVDLFEFYCQNATMGISQVERALKKGVLLTRRENIDALFKVYITGKTYKAKEFTKYMDKFDKCLVKFMAYNFLRTLDLKEEGYSFRSVRKFVNDLLFRAWYDGLCKGRYKAYYSDLNGVLTVEIVQSGEVVTTYEIKDSDSLMEMCSSLIAYFSSDSETEDRKFLEDYIYVELSRYLLKKPTKVYIDKRKHSLSEVVNKHENRITSLISDKVVQVKFG